MNFITNIHDFCEAGEAVCQTEGKQKKPLRNPVNHSGHENEMRMIDNYVDCYVDNYVDNYVESIVRRRKA